MKGSATFVPKSVKAIAILFFAISKFGETARHLARTRNQSDGYTLSVNKHKYLRSEERITKKQQRQINGSITKLKR